MTKLGQDDMAQKLLPAKNSHPLAMPSTSERVTEVEQAHDALRSHTRDVARLAVLSARSAPEGEQMRPINNASPWYSAWSSLRYGQMSKWREAWLPSSMHGASPSEKAHIDELAGPSVNKVVDHVRFHRPEAPDVDHPRAATVAFNFTCEGSAARGSFRETYKMGWTQFAFEDELFQNRCVMAMSKQRQRTMHDDRVTLADLSRKLGIVMISTAIGVRQVSFLGMAARRPDMSIERQMLWA